MNDIPPGVEIPPPIVDKSGGPQCENCTHYKAEHVVEEENCMHVMYYLKQTDEEKQVVAIPGRKLCDCKKFVSVEK